MSDSKQLGEYLRMQRKKKGLTLVELSEKSGVSQPYLSQIENGKGGIPSPDILFKLTKPLGLTHAQLMIKAGHIQLGQFDHEDDILETDYEAGMREKEYQERIAKINEMAVLKKDLSNFLQQPDITYHGHQLTDQDKQLIAAYLDALYRDRISSEK
ncbi:helix-turn-helix transcriptional regulator [Brevibacillus choshinensis]|uniref:helix-turn-helix domain-containing protein n=1 Tax=Brevibacillus choshinensis TaxID=54911 RepID=UPI002E22F03A|nr:helix-turn-helix transcriptional regulator [Brevibacillus choshinensis]